MAKNDAPSNGEPLVLEALPDDVVASIEVRDKWRRNATVGIPGLEFIVADLQRWPTGSIVRVAFLDGDKDLHGAVATAAQQVDDAASITLDFGVDPATGEHRRWTEKDTDYAAEIRISFDMPGYWSLVGTDSTDRMIGASGGPVGGGPSQRSLNLGGSKTNRPPRWEGTVRHELMHALAFHHAHQNLRGPCADEFRWEDDAGYVPTRDGRGVFVPDAAGRRPGIYTYLAGPPNNWSRAKVDHNLRAVNDPDLVLGPFDPASVMLYRFDPFFYQTEPSPCAPTGDGISLSDGDRRGLDLLYPAQAKAVDAAASEAAERMAAIAGVPDTGDAGDAEYKARATELLKARAAVRP